jgi:hypothetical protein
VTASDRDLIGDEAAEAAEAAMSAAFRAYTGTRRGEQMWNLDMEQTWEIVSRAGLAAALPHLADACDALRAAERSRVSTPTPKPITAVSGNLSGLQGHSAPTHNPTDTTQEDRP